MALILSKEQPTEAFAVARDFKKFNLLVEDLDDEFSGSWRQLTFKDGIAALQKSNLQALEFVIVAVDRDDEKNLDQATGFIKTAKALGVRVILIASDMSPIGLHQLMRLGSDDFAPYPLPDGALADSVRRLCEKSHATPATAAPKRHRHGVILPVFGLSGGVGASTFAVNLAWEIATFTKKTDRRVALLDFNFQFGSVATYLDLPRREAIYELITDASSMDHDALAQALTSFKSRLAVLTAPMDALPLDIISAEDVVKLLDITASSYDFVIVDLPSTLVAWSDDVLQKAETFFALLEIDMRSAQNTLRFLRALKAEDLPFEKVQFALNRSPGFTDLSGKSRVKRLSESLGVDINILLPDGGRAVTNCCDQGLPLSENAPKNPLRKEIRRIAESIVNMVEAEKAAVVE
jgi:pilus assembly protein CpaE